MAKSTPKSYVQRRWPGAKAEKFGNGWFVYVRSKPHGSEVLMGSGFSPREAWVDAKRRVKQSASTDGKADGLGS